jgi:hypothetical protein
MYSNPELRPADLHAFACLGQGGQAARTAISMRHNNLCHKLGSIQQSQGARDLCYEPQMNDHNGADNGRALRTDERAVVDGFTHYLEVSVVTAPLPSVIQVGAAHYDAAAASDREAKKTAKYRQMSAVNVNNSSITPFVLETHGRLGKQATDILRKLSRDRDAGTHHDRHEDCGAAVWNA